jgi:maltose alpha-D-glucosyltransferase/alpha-amylase
MENKFSRRSFIESVATAVAGLGLLKASEPAEAFGKVFRLNSLRRTVTSRTDSPERGITGKYIIPPDCPKWVNNAVFYQVYPQSFYDSNGDGIGDLPGIIQKLDYIKSLGVDAVWINPFFESPFGDGGYDISNYYKVAPRYGTNDDAKRLFEEAHKRGLRILIDFVVSYTSIEHPWFKASAQQKKNNYSSWYIWTDNVWLNPPQQFQGAFIKGYGMRDGQYMQNFYYSEPALNYGFAQPDQDQKWELPTDHPDVLAMREEIKSVLRFWMKMGADGFRADMAGALVKTSVTEGNKSGASGQFLTTHEEGTKQFWREIRGILREDFPEAFMISEWSYPVSSLDGCFHADFFHWFEGYNDLFQKESWRILNGCSEGHSYFDEEGKGDITFFLGKFMEQYDLTKGEGYISLPLGNHDNARLGNKRNDVDLEIIYAFGLTMPGVTFIYYGNEIGMRQMPENWPQVEGAYCPRNGARTPMQWARGKNLGFSPAPSDKVYLPVDPTENAPTVEDQEKDQSSLLNKTRKLIEMRRSEPALAAYAEFVPLFAKKDTYPFIYARAKDKDVVLVILNPSSKKSKASFELNVPYSELVLLAGKNVCISRSENRISMNVPERSYAIYKLG